MTTRRSRFERRSSEQKIEKARLERFIKNATESRELLDTVIEEATAGDMDKALDSLVEFDQQIERVYTQGRRMDENER